MTLVNVSAQPRRIAVLSIHTSPLDQPGTGDAGGLNVYVVETAKRLARRGIAVDIFTRRTRPDLPDAVELAPGVIVRHVDAGPYSGLRKEDLPAQLCAVTNGILHAEALQAEGTYDLVHSHYWLSGQVGWLTSDRWNVPLVHTMHTMAKVKNEALAEGDAPEPETRVIGEEQVVQAAAVLVANTVQEAVELERYYDADPERIVVAHPGVDLETFAPRDGRLPARERLGIPSQAVMLLFIGRIQPLKAPDVLLRAAAVMLREDPALRDRLQVVVCGGPSGAGLERPEALIALADELGIAANTRFIPPQSRADLADYYRAADLVTVPSYSESFGLVAIEAQACGTPVVAAAVGGLTTAVSNNVSGLLVEGHDPAVWAERMLSLLHCATCMARLRAGTTRHAALFSWDRTVDALVDAYKLARGRHFRTTGVVQNWRHG